MSSHTARCWVSPVREYAGIGVGLCHSVAVWIRMEKTISHHSFDSPRLLYHHHLRGDRVVVKWCAFLAYSRATCCSVSRPMMATVNKRCGTTTTSSGRWSPTTITRARDDDEWTRARATSERFDRAIGQRERGGGTRSPFLCPTPRVETVRLGNRSLSARPHFLAPHRPSDDVVVVSAREM